jgi:hypothetical protein
VKAPFVASSDVVANFEARNGITAIEGILSIKELFFRQNVLHYQR